MKELRSILPFCLLFLTLAGCDDLDDKIYTPDNTLEVQDFIWKGLNHYYYWQESVGDLSDNRFPSNEAYTDFLENYTDPEALFDHLLSDEDRFSYITSDYRELQNSQAGTDLSSGMEFGLVRVSGTDDVLGYVRYIIPGSNAASKPVKRGDLFNSINGIHLTIDNYYDLLYNDAISFTIGKATLDNSGTVIDTGETVELLKLQLTENPVLIAKVLQAGDLSVGYLMYNRFTRTFENELNQAFGDLARENIQELIIDLRYNPGGSISTATLLASLITGQFNGKLFTRLVYNSKVQQEISSGNSEYHLSDRIDGISLNQLSLNRVYIITSSRTASASELIINGLNPYIDIIKVGDVTTGKNEASITLYDSPSFGFDDPGLNPNHTWAMQPLVSRNQNADGFSDYTDGFQPDYLLKENLRDLGILGETDEPLLARTLELITSVSSKITTKYPPYPADPIDGSENKGPASGNMLDDQ
ncbi:S41 family peptidase [Robertkochia solimangrovi]|uniref:S41 family peptidase n=1 Tax=Robertkochia solimangrovi TaxID=2213046 RepID=UPI00117F0A26|nr:S41 family peptidase [Robertkochia solimangrovi]TRZ43652.1 hypothetical protein DMZ48_09565 [Robertkochia solimangrovi]